MTPEEREVVGAAVDDLDRAADHITEMIDYDVVLSEHVGDLVRVDDARNKLNGLLELGSQSGGNDDGV